MEKIKYRLPNDGKRHRVQQKFDKEKIFVIKAGQKINVYDAIQAANEDTEIYKTLEKYGSIESMYKTNIEEIQKDFDEYVNLRSLQEKNQQAENMWLKLPAGVREQFKNDKLQFLENGQKWLKKITEKAEEKIQEQKKQHEVKENEQK